MIIAVKFLGPTNFRGSRYSATTTLGPDGEKCRVVVPYDYGVRFDETELVAVEKLLAKVEQLTGSVWEVDGGCLGIHPTTGESLYRANWIGG